MKAILVIDINGSLIEGEDKFAIDGYLMQESDCAGCYEAVGYIKNVPLKPLPEKLYVGAKRIEDVMSSEFDIDKFILKIQLDADKLFALGWNACIEVIEKGERKNV